MGQLSSGPEIVAPGRLQTRLLTVLGRAEKHLKEEMIHVSVADIDEHRLIDLVLDDPDPYTRSNVFGLAGVPEDAVALRRVSLKDTPGAHEGDIDVLLCSPREPERSVAIEVKTVKARAGTLEVRINKLSKTKKGIRQANLLALIGFSQVYLYVFVLVDSREQNQGKISYDGLSGETRHQVESVISVYGLDDAVGLLQCDFVQPWNCQPLLEGSRRIHLHHPAATVKQPAALTRWIEKEVASKVGVTIFPSPVR